jgi:hypothetical protein
MDCIRPRLALVLARNPLRPSMIYSRPLAREPSNIVLVRPSETDPTALVDLPLCVTGEANDASVPYYSCGCFQFPKACALDVMPSTLCPSTVENPQSLPVLVGTPLSSYSALFIRPSFKIRALVKTIPSGVENLHTSFVHSTFMLHVWGNVIS